MSQSRDSLLGGFEICVRPPEDADFQVKEDRTAIFANKMREGPFRRLQNLNSMVRLYQHSLTKRHYVVVHDVNVVEIRTSPTGVEDVSATLKPLFDVSRALGWAHDYGGGHLHIDATPMKRNPVQVVNFLIRFHNDPALMKLFRPLEYPGGAKSWLESGKQEEFISAVSQFRAIANPTWANFVQLFSPLLTRENAFRLGMGYLHMPETLEVRAILNQQSPEEGEAQLKFFESVWNSAPKKGFLQPVRWTWSETRKALHPAAAVPAIRKALKSLGLSVSKYEVFLNRYLAYRNRELEKENETFKKFQHERKELQARRSKKALDNGAENKSGLPPLKKDIPISAYTSPGSAGHLRIQTETLEALNDPEYFWTSEWGNLINAEGWRRVPKASDGSEATFGQTKAGAESKDRDVLIEPWRKALLGYLERATGASEIAHVARAIAGHDWSTDLELRALYLEKLGTFYRGGNAFHDSFQAVPWLDQPDMREIWLKSERSPFGKRESHEIYPNPRNAPNLELDSNTYTKEIHLLWQQRKFFSDTKVWSVLKSELGLGDKEGVPLRPTRRATQALREMMGLSVESMPLDHSSPSFDWWSIPEARSEILSRYFGQLESSPGGPSKGTPFTKMLPLEFHHNAFALSIGETEFLSLARAPWFEDSGLKSALVGWMDGLEASPQRRAMALKLVHAVAAHRGKSWWEVPGIAEAVRMNLGIESQPNTPEYLTDATRALAEQKSRFELAKEMNVPPGYLSYLYPEHMNSTCKLREALDLMRHSGR